MLYREIGCAYLQPLINHAAKIMPIAFRSELISSNNLVENGRLDAFAS